MHGRDVQQYPFDYDWPKRFPEHELVLGGEGSSVFSAQGGGAWWLIFDDGTLADFMDPVLDAERLATMVRVERFDEREEWAAAVEQLRRRMPRGQRMVKRLRADD